MDKEILHHINVQYIPANAETWTGRKSNPILGNQYWYQAIELGNIDQIKKRDQPTIALIGYSCDEGVRRNFGRIGAANGPKVLKEKLAKLPLHVDSKKIVDYGELVCVDKDMEACQLAFSKLVTALILKEVFTIGIGGGHDIAYGHFMGIKEALKTKAHHKIGIINFDAHFDLRPIEEAPNSGTPFNQILLQCKQDNLPLDYFVIGIQQQSNTKELFSIAQTNQVQYVQSKDCENSDNAIRLVQEKLRTFIQQNDYLYITIDLDGFSVAYAPGVSAPSALGFTPHFVYNMLSFIFESNKVIACDIAELNPNFDQDNRTAVLGAKLIDFISGLYNPANVQ